MLIVYSGVVDSSMDACNVRCGVGRRWSEVLKRSVAVAGLNFLGFASALGFPGSSQGRQVHNLSPYNLLTTTTSPT
eukprot:scaffold583_cov154-Skeletonema_menzelii.AAC.5